MGHLSIAYYLTCRILMESFIPALRFHRLIPKNPKQTDAIDWSQQKTSTQNTQYLSSGL